MAWNQRMQALLDQCDPEQEDDLVSELIELESQLTIHELMLLVRVVVMDGADLWEPLWHSMFMKDKSGELTDIEYPISAAASLPECTLRELAGQARLERLGLLVKRETPNSWEFALTPKGARAVDWWAGTLVDDLGFQLPAELTTPT